MRAELIERTGLDERFENAPIDLAAVHASTQVEKVLERSVCLPRLENHLDCTFSEPFDCTEAVKDRFVVERNKTVFAAIYIGRQNGELHVATLGDHGHDLVGLVHVR